MVYVALLRGINAGGRMKVNMGELTETFERIGMKSVTTYINSGNIIFEDLIHNKEFLSPIIEGAIREDFSLAVTVLIRSLEDFRNIIEKLPVHWSNDKEMKSDVLFLQDEIDNESILESLFINPVFDRIIYIPGTVLWSIEMKDLKKSNILLGKPSKVSRHITVRNVNSTRKIYSIMEEVGKNHKTI